MTFEAQRRLLRVLQNEVVERIGGSHTTAFTTDVRIIAATHRNIGKLIQAEQFRRDLFYRPNVLPIHLPRPYQSVIMTLQVLHIIFDQEIQASQELI